MTALDLTEAVEAGARAAWEDWRERRPTSGLAAWEDAREIDRHKMREAHLPVVDAAAGVIEAQVRASIAVEIGVACVSVANDPLRPERNRGPIIGGLVMAAKIARGVTS